MTNFVSQLLMVVVEWKLVCIFINIYRYKTCLCWTRTLKIKNGNNASREQITKVEVLEMSRAWLLYAVIYKRYTAIYEWAAKTLSLQNIAESFNKDRTIWGETIGSGRTQQEIDRADADFDPILVLW